MIEDPLHCTLDTKQVIFLSFDIDDVF
jgi:hypothetical protein